MNITITLTEKQAENVSEIILNEMRFLEDEYYIDPNDPISDIDENSDKAQEVERTLAISDYIGLKRVREKLINPPSGQTEPPPKFYQRPSDGFFYYLDEYDEDILCCFPDADDENQPDTETTLYLRDCQSEFENGDTFESIVAEVEPILRGYELKRKTDRSL